MLGDGLQGLPWCKGMAVRYCPGVRGWGSGTAPVLGDGLRGWASGTALVLEDGCW